jgi:hypothetical protein
MSKYLIDEIERTSNIVLEAQHAGAGGLWRRAAGGLRLKGPRGAVGAGFVAVCVYRRGAGTAWLPASILRDENGFVLAGPDLRSCGQAAGGMERAREPFLLESSVPGVFVAGDVRHGSVKRVASAVGEGSIAVQFAHQYLAGVLGMRDEYGDEGQQIEIESVPLRGGCRGAAPDRSLCGNELRRLRWAALAPVDRVTAKAGAVLVEPGPFANTGWFSRARCAPTGRSRTARRRRWACSRAGEGFGETPLLTGKDGLRFV